MYTHLFKKAYVFRYPKLKQWFENMSRQEICKKINQPGAEDHVSGLKALMKHNKENQKSKL